MHVLLSGLPGSGKCRIIESVLDEFDDVIWVTTMSSARFVRKRLNRDDVWIVDTFTWGKSGESERDLIVSNPLNLNEISLTISRIMEKIKGRYLLVMNSISGLLIYHSHQRLIHFIRTIMARIESENGAGIFTLVKGAQDKSVEISIMMFFPNILEVEGDVRVIKSGVPLEKNVFGFEEAKDLIVNMLEG